MTGTRITRWVTLLGLVLVMVLLASLLACGSEEPTPTPSPTIEPTPTPAPTIEPTATPSPTIEPTPMPTPSPTPETTSTETDREALVALYNATDGPNWTNNTNWLSEEPVWEWHGVTCDANHRVTALMLRDNWLRRRDAWGVGPAIQT